MGQNYYFLFDKCPFLIYMIRLYSEVLDVIIAAGLIHGKDVFGATQPTLDISLVQKNA